jgi:hypothetical protein
MTLIEDIEIITTPLDEECDGWCYDCDGGCVE